MPSLSTVFTLKEVHDPNVERVISDHKSRRGCLETQVFWINENTVFGETVKEYENHLVVARLILEKVTFEMNCHYDKTALPSQRKNYPITQTDFDKLDPSGVKISFEEFIGSHNLNVPIVPGQLTDSKAYFEKYPDTKGGFMTALLDPPYGMSFKDSSMEAHMQDFLNTFFGDLNLLTIYAWDTHCSSVFDVGHEWWGSYFWTIYSPSKDWFIGLIASQRD